MRRALVVCALITGCNGLEQRILDEQAQPTRTFEGRVLNGDADVDGEVESDVYPDDGVGLGAWVEADGGSDAVHDVVGATGVWNGRGWTRTFGGSEQDWPCDLVVTGDGSVIVSGTFAGTADFDPGPTESLRTATGDRDLFILKLGPDGAMRWVRTIDLGHTLDLGVSMAMSPDEGVIITGQYVDTVDFDPDPATEVVRASDGGRDIFVLSLGPTGEHRWVRTLGGAGDDVGTELVVLPDGDLLVAGQLEGVAELESPSGSGVLGSEGLTTSLGMRLATEDGEPMWVNPFASGDAGWVDSLVPLRDGAVVVSGRFLGSMGFDLSSGVEVVHESMGEHDVFVLLIDSGGAVEWVRVYGQAGEDWATGAVVTESGNLLITGLFEFGISFDLDLTEDHEAQGRWDAFLLELDRDGTHQWSMTFGGNGWDWGAGIRASSSNVLVTGSFSSEVDFDLEGMITGESEGMWDFYLMSLDTERGIEWVRTWGGDGRDYAEQIAVGPDGSIYLTGNFQGSVSFAPCASTDDIHVARGESDGFVTRLLPNGCYR